MKIRVLCSVLFIFASSLCIFGQLSIPRESQRQEISQTVGIQKFQSFIIARMLKATLWGFKQPCYPKERDLSVSCAKRTSLAHRR